MSNNLLLYHKILAQVRQWLPQERITRLRNLAFLVMGVYRSASVNLSKIVRKWPQPGKLVSLTNRLRRFLDNPRVEKTVYMAPLARSLLASHTGGQVVLIIDLTQVGCHYRTLVVGIAYRKRCLPLMWSVHPGEKGSVEVNEILALLGQVQEWLPADVQVILVGDAGFPSTDLLLWLRAQGWSYVLSQHANRSVRKEGEKWLALQQIPIQAGQTIEVGWVWMAKTTPFGPCWLLLHWKKGEEHPWILFSNLEGTKTVLSLYAKRMWIDELYGDLKGHGFDLESTHLGSPERIETLLLGVVLAYIWLISLGSWLVKQGLRHWIDRNNRRDKSYFRLGWDWVERCIQLVKPIRVQFIPLL
jgi:hypothetical protein